jgi:hypothetical protein
MMNPLGVSISPLEGSPLHFGAGPRLPASCNSALGHASTAITSDLYQHVLPPMDRDAADRIAGILRGDDDAGGVEL